MLCAHYLTLRLRHKDYVIWLAYTEVVIESHMIEKIFRLGELLSVEEAAPLKGGILPLQLLHSQHLLKPLLLQSPSQLLVLRQDIREKGEFLFLPSNRCSHFRTESVNVVAVEFPPPICEIRR